VSRSRSLLAPPRAATRRRGRQIGPRLRAAREARALSLRALAERVGLTASLLSQIETGQVTPSVDTLFALAEGLDLAVTYFFADVHTPLAPAPGSLVVRRADRRRVELDHGVVWESLVPAEEPGIEWMMIHYPPGAVSAATPQRHGGRDYGVVVRGCLTARVGFADYQLQRGDAIAFDASIPHQLRNDGQAAVEAVWLVLDRHAAHARPCHAPGTEEGAPRQDVPASTRADDDGP